MLKFFVEKMWVAFAVQKLLTFFQQKISEYCVLNPLKQLTKWPLTSSLSQQRFEQPDPGIHIHIFTLNILGKNFKQQHFKTFCTFFPENRFWHFMKIVSTGDNLHEMSEPFFSGKKKAAKYHQSVVCWISTGVVKVMGSWYQLLLR